MNNQGNQNFNNHQRPNQYGHPQGYGYPQNQPQAPNPNYNPNYNPNFNQGYNQGYNPNFNQTVPLPVVQKKSKAPIVAAIIVGIVVVIAILAAVIGLVIHSLISGRSPVETVDDPVILTPANNGLDYEEIFVGDTISTDFVTFTVDRLATATTIESIDSSVVMNAESGEEYVYIRGKVKNTSDSTYDLGSMGSMSDGNTDMMIDAELVMTNGKAKTGFLFVDDGGIYGLISEGELEPGEEVTYYIAFLLDRSLSEYYMNGEIKIGFTEDFKVKPLYDHSNCDYIYKIDVR